MADAQGLAKPVERLRTITLSVVRHRPLDPDVEAFVPGHGCDLEGHAAFLPLALADRTEGQAGIVIDRDMDELPADAPAIALAVAVACNVMADAVEPTQFLEVHVNHLAGAALLIAGH